MTMGTGNILEGKKIFIMEDDQFISRVYAKWLSTLGATTVVANDGALGLHLLTEERPDLILLDLGMPGLNGYDTLVALKKQPTMKDIPVVIVTNTTVQENTAYYKDIVGAGAAGILRKYETSLDELVKCVQTHLTSSRDATDNNRH